MIRSSRSRVRRGRDRGLHRAPERPGLLRRQRDHPRRRRRPHRRSGPAPTPPEARLHRRLRDAMEVLRVNASLDDGSLADVRSQLEAARAAHRRAARRSRRAAEGASGGAADRRSRRRSSTIEATVAEHGRAARPDGGDLDAGHRRHPDPSAADRRSAVAELAALDPTASDLAALRDHLEAEERPGAPTRRRRRLPEPEWLHRCAACASVASQAMAGAHLRTRSRRPAPTFVIVAHRRARGRWRPSERWRPSPPTTRPSTQPKAPRPQERPPCLDDGNGGWASLSPCRTLVRSPSPSSATSTPRGRSRDRLAADPENFVGPFADVLRAADLAIGNLEAAVTTGGTAATKDFTFRAPPGILDALRCRGARRRQRGEQPRPRLRPGRARRTRWRPSAARADGMLIGVGGDEDEAYAPYVADVGGQRVAVIAATQVIDGDLHLVLDRDHRTGWSRVGEAGRPAGRGGRGCPGDRRHGRRLPPLGDRDRDLPELGRSGSWPRRWPTPAPTSSSVDMPTASRALAAWANAFVGYGLGNFLFGGDEAATAPRPACCWSGSTAARSSATSGARAASSTACPVPSRAMTPRPRSPSGTISEDCTGLTEMTSVRVSGRSSRRRRRWSGR